MTIPSRHFKARSLLLCFFLISFALAIGLSLLAPLINLPERDPVWILMTYILLMGLLSLWILRRFEYLRIELEHVVGRSPNPKTWLKSCSLVLALLLFSAGAGLLFFWFLATTAPNFTQSLLQSAQLQGDPQTRLPGLYKILLGIVLVVVAPITEELIFRGVLFQRWAVKWGIRPALIASSIIFGICHANVVGLTMFGLVMGLLYIRTRSLLIPMGCHALNNAIAGLALLAPNDNDGAVTTNLAYFQTYGSIGLIMVSLTLPWLIWFITRNFPAKTTLIPYLMNKERSPQ